jgi:hypothetical protein
MPQWMDELDELIKGMSKPAGKADADTDRDDEYDAEDGDGEDDGEDDGEEPFRKSAAKGCYPPADNGDDDDMPSGPAVRDPEKIERLTRGNKIKKPAGANAGTGSVSKSVRDMVDGDTADAINAADALGAIADAIDSLTAGFAKSLRRITHRLDEVDQAQALIGTAVTKSLTGNQAILKSLQADVEAVAAQPRGRKGVQKGVERKFAGSDAPAAPTKQELLTKSFAALQAGRINAHECATVESYLNGNRQLGRLPQLPPAELLAKIGD